MIKRLVVKSLFFLFLISLLLYIGGVRPPLRLSSDVMNFLRRVVTVFESWKFELPTAPAAVTGLGSGFDAFVNWFIDFWNGLISIINVVISLLQFMITLITQLFQFISQVTRGYA